MRRNSVFWGLVIVLVGVALLLNNLLPGVNVHLYLWPGLLILAGLWFLLAPAWRRGRVEVQPVSIPLGNIQSAELRLQHGAGKLELSAVNRPGMLLEGEFTGGVKVIEEQGAPAARFRLQSSFFNEDVMIPGFSSGSGLLWNVGLTPEIPLQLRFETGACEARIDLTGLQVTEVRLQTGASRTDLTLPATAGLTRVSVESGLAGVVIRVPQAVAARVKVSSGLAGISVASRFPLAGGFYASPDFDSAANKAEISIDTALGSVEII